jgi:ribosome maturation factor RimP
VVKKAQTLAEIIAPAVTLLGYEFVGCVHIAQGRHSSLRVYIDNERGITLDDCEKASRQISAVLDVEDPIASQYSLEVSSPGLDRPLFTLAHFQRFIGQRASVRLHAPLNGRRHFTGKLCDVVNEDVLIEVDANVFTLPFADIEKANLIPE